MQYQYLPSDQAQLQVDNEDIKRKQQMAQAFQQAGFNPVQGGNQILSLIASMASTLRGNSMMKDSSKSLSENLTKQFEMQNQADQAKAEAAQRQREEDFQRELQKIDFGNKSKSQYTQRNIDPLSPEGIAAQLGLEKGKAGLKPQGSGQTELDRKIAQLKQLGATDDQIRGMLLGNQGGSSAPSGYRATADGKLEAIPGGPADKPKEGDPKAAAAQQALEILSQLEGNLGASGPVDKYLHPVDSQKFDKTLAQLVNPLQTLTRIPGQGAQSDKELAALMESFPASGNFDSTNKQQIQNLRSYIERLQQAGGQGQPPSGAPPSGAQQQAAQSQPTQTATNPQTGQKIGLINGQWVPI